MEITVLSALLMASISAAIPSTAHSFTLSDEERAGMQEELNLQCEKARGKKLYPERLKIYEACKAAGKEENLCDMQAEMYNGDRIGGAPRHYDLPECVKAFEFRKAHRTR